MSAIAGDAGQPGRNSLPVRQRICPRPRHRWRGGTFGRTVRDLTSGNVELPIFVRGVGKATVNTAIRQVRRAVFAIGHRVTHQPGLRAAQPALIPESAGMSGRRPEPVAGGLPALQRLVDIVRPKLEALLVEHPQVRGSLTKTPSTVLNLQEGELVQVRSKEEIIATLDINNKNRGLLFDVEMLPDRGGTYRVLRQVQQIVDEKTGRMLRMPNNCVILEGVFCKGCLSSRRLFCPRGIYPFWHEIWLKRAE